jgi:hypothetical protein
VGKTIAWKPGRVDCVCRVFGFRRPRVVDSAMQIMSQRFNTGLFEIRIFVKVTTYVE